MFFIHEEPLNYRVVACQAIPPGVIIGTHKMYQQITLSKGLDVFPFLKKMSSRDLLAPMRTNRYVAAENPGNYHVVGLFMPPVSKTSRVGQISAKMTTKENGALNILEDLRSKIPLVH